MSTLRSGINLLADVMPKESSLDVVRAETGADANDRIYDSSWIHKAFMVTVDDLEDMNDKFNFTSSTAMFKFSDSKVGGGGALNPRPQHTRTADLPTGGTLDRFKLDVAHPHREYGLGRMYSETLDDFNHRIYMTFGIPEFNSLLKFFYTFSDANARSWATLGHGTSIFRKVGDVLGTYFAVFSPSRWSKKIIAGGVVVRGAAAAAGAVDSGFYSLKPTMPAYWLSVNSIVNDVGINLGLLSTKPSTNKSWIKKMGKTQEMDDVEIAKLSKDLGDGILDDDGFINMFNVIRRNYSLKRIGFHHQSFLEKPGNTVYNGYHLKRDSDGEIIKRELPTQPPINASVVNLGTAAIRGAYITGKEFYNKYVELVEAHEESKKIGVTDVADQAGIVLDAATSTVGHIWDNIMAVLGGKIEKDAIKDMYDEDGNYVGDRTARSKGMIDSMIALEQFSADNGLNYVVFEVDPPSSPSDSFSNSTESSGLKDAMNSGAAIGRKMKFSLAGGNVAGGAIKYITDSLTDLASGTINGFTFGITNFIENLFHGVNAEIPDQWSGSESSLSNVDYKMSLVSPYPNAYAQLQNLYIPMASVLGGVWPLKAGNRSHVSPFLVRLYDRGTNVVNLGIITNVTVTRGITNQGFTQDGRPLSFDLTFTIANLEPILSMPMASGATGLFGLNANVSNNQYTDYLASLTGMAMDLHPSHGFAGTRLRLGAVRLSRSFRANQSYFKTSVAESLAGASSLFSNGVDHR